MKINACEIVLASSNPGKLKEFQQMLSGMGVSLRPQSDFNIAAVEETGLSFVENAILKARHASKQSGLPAIADDSGLEVDALAGRPGIYSARFAGSDATDSDNNRKLLSVLRGVSPEERKARFQCVLVYMRHPEDPTPVICQGSWEGEILNAPKGEQGFGYDPLFYVSTEGCACAELSADVKNRLSHRAKAMAQLADRLRVTC
ncbi:RdgB/HAM1 family non-canonical purine NTP pyrophosphatase [Candidatus Sororendozoicomonas aggregata]|uniref:RdgB/HAM1 family non-canonical purine NTP pyrophosphatase n=1 Tax=Candidatus Sororendozoicomonas aggregata TaxID=3073239 RepID=UPI002ED298AA